MSKRQPVRIRLTLLGAKGVGKSALMVRFLTRRFIGEYDSLESTYRRQIIIGSNTCVVEVKDTSPLENKTTFNSVDCNWPDVFVFVYSITQTNSFDEIVKLHDLIEKNRRKPTLFVIVANKKDLRHLREVQTERGRNLSKLFNCPFYEISAAEGYQETNIVFNDLIRYVICCKANEEPASLKKRTNSFSYFLKVLEKQYRTNKDNYSLLSDRSDAVLSS